MHSFKMKIQLEILYDRSELSGAAEGIFQLSNRTYVPMMLVRNTIHLNIICLKSLCMIKTWKHKCYITYNKVRYSLLQKPPARRQVNNPVLWEPTLMQAKSSAASSYTPIWLSTPVKNHKAGRRGRNILLSSYSPHEHTASQPVSIAASSGTSRAEIFHCACVLLRMLFSILDNITELLSEWLEMKI